MKITGTLINYYFHCKRQCWLFGNRINLEDNSEDVRIGRVLHELKDEEKDNTEISIENIKIDRITKDYLIEIKKSDADIEAVKWQVLLYLKKLKDKGIDKKGKIEFIEKNKQDKKIHYIELTDAYEKELIELSNKINNLLATKRPPLLMQQAKISNKCKKCAYYSYCYI
ncbi:MAG: CRISPR-associated protein Cas4 [Candidatus Infernicultor aquiphilus]|uniref:CRISPR-associated protein Cas4 n=1 Tax=Candidatus Infernicultor aquiphilus TaxID=1805029 RepID=A0A2M7K9I2_9BACT|nr:MAG: CRISPR-associated protein Cas4 [Candidatus Atribacteria bacterium CG08_land_8_20_14_0_20_33_29]PIW12323.1 MAG: CRISPR-associated protein Cas4 [Candidatus Atribacteria bacterium CG17_big_fil_post_rev_8_21_14_2_50_34_11]PIX34796.1 MAG: CRISPR-associated protein Cas4 [Candidatus Atribacteria bacterium CG_4_8_14_3_um_filter_34_18]PIY33115.1 MAG: CRISPR-associated protein Cas4 [Candidatus Atribacteria bacterium CG_4_10_14_3_um_filter_34_13]